MFRVISLAAALSVLPGMALAGKRFPGLRWLTSPRDLDDTQMTLVIATVAALAGFVIFQAVSRRMSPGNVLRPFFGMAKAGAVVTAFVSAGLFFSHSTALGEGQQLQEEQVAVKPRLPTVLDETPGGAKFVSARTD